MERSGAPNTGSQGRVENRNLRPIQDFAFSGKLK
jgi:hypothetical protein